MWKKMKRATRFLWMLLRDVLATILVSGIVGVAFAVMGVILPVLAIVFLVVLWVSQRWEDAGR